MSNCTEKYLNRCKIESFECEVDGITCDKLYLFDSFDYYRSGTVNSNTVNSKFHLIRSYCEYLARILSFHV